MSIGEAIRILHTRDYGNYQNRRKVVIAIRKLIYIQPESEHRTKIMKAIKDTSGIICVSVYRAALSYFRINKIKEIKT